MQNEENAEYSGLDELLNIEQCLPNYNEYIVSLCRGLVSADQRVVDFGAGIGTLAMIFRAKYELSPICVEIDKVNIAYLNERGFQVQDDVSKVDGEVDLLFSSNVLEHIEDDTGALREMKAKLSDNGYLFLFLPSQMMLWTKMDEVVGHYRRYGRKEISDKLASEGFRVTRLHYADSLGFLASLFMKLAGFDSQTGLGSPKSLKFYDKYVLPLSRLIDSLGGKFIVGKNIVVIARPVT